MAPVLRHALLLPVLTATFAATAVAGKGGRGFFGAPVAATTTATRAGQQHSPNLAERKSDHNPGKKTNPAAHLHTSEQWQQEHQRQIRERLRRRRRRQRQHEDEEVEQQQLQEQEQVRQTGWTRRPRRRDEDKINGNIDSGNITNNNHKSNDKSNSDSDNHNNNRNEGKGGGGHDCNDVNARRRKNPPDILAAVGDVIKSRAQRSLQAVPEIGTQHQQQQRRRVGWAGRGEVGAGGRKPPLAFGNPLAGISGKVREEEEEEEEEELHSAERLALQAENDASVEEVLSVIESDGWEHVTNKSGVTVVRKFLPPPPKASSGGGVVDEGAAAKFACVKAMGTLDAEAGELYKLFLDNERVHEYNDNCKELRDLEQLTEDTKVSWASTPRYGPFKSRDFVTTVHYRTLEDGTMMVINRPIEHPDARRSKKFVRAEILIATNIMRPNREDPRKTDFISVTHINPGGIADTTIGAKVVNKLCAKAPVNLLLALERSANSAPVPKKGKAVKVSSG